MNKRAHAVFHGYVQGVCFRAYTQDKASEEGVTGWVRNLRNGDVEAVFEGDEAAVQRVIDYCSTGQPHARVSNIDLAWEEYRGEFGDFSVRR